MHWYLSFNLDSYILGNFLTISPSCCDNAACFPYAGIFVSTDGRHVCESPCVSSTADPLSFFLSFFPRSHPNSGGLIFSLSLLHCSSLPFSLPFLPCMLSLVSPSRARQGLIAQRHHWSMRVFAYRALPPAGFHPEMQSYLHTSCQNLAGR